jgi:hypothetical protein
MDREREGKGRERQRERENRRYRERALGRTEFFDQKVKHESFIWDSFYKTFLKS